MKYFETLEKLENKISEMRKGLHFEINHGSETIQVQIQVSGMNIIRFRNPDDAHPEEITLRFNDLEDIMEFYLLKRANGK